MQQPTVNQPQAAAYPGQPQTPAYPGQPQTPAYPGQQPAYPGQPGSGQKPNKKTIIKIVAIVAAIAVLIGGFFGGRSLIRSSRYRNATELMQAGNYQEAKEIFENLPSDYEDAAFNAEQCQKYLDYNAAMDLLNAGNYEAAAAAFERLGSFNDAAQKAKECNMYIDYDKAVDLYNSGKFYDAYVLFTNLGDFKDSTAKAQDCIQPFPNSSVIFRDSSFEGDTAGMIIRNGSNSARVYMIYDENDKHVATMFINAGGQVSMDVPAGVYSFKVAEGKYWFGNEDMFGSGVTFYPLYDPEGNTGFDFLEGYDSTLTTM